MDILDMQVDEQPTIERVWSPQQRGIFGAIEGTGEDLLVQAVAGSGKTTTIIEGMRYAQGTSLFLAFNKAIAEDIRRRVESGDVKTLNALGHRLWGENRPAAKLDAKKTLKLLAARLGDESSDYKEHGYTLSRIVGLMKNSAMGLDGEGLDGGAVADLIDAYQMEIPAESVDKYADVCVEAMEAGLNDDATFDFDDQLYGPLFHNWRYPRYDNLFVDETQDLSPIQHVMLGVMLERGRLIAVGDRHQAIYGFRGALVDSMDQLKRKFDMSELPLSTTYRCGRAIVAAAQVYCPQIQPREGAEDGLVTNAEDSDSGEPDLFADQVMILCRNNAPLFAAILRHVRAKSPCIVLSNFLDSFRGFIRGFKTTYTSDLMTKLDRWYERESEAARKKGYKGKAHGLKDRYQTVKLLAGEFKCTDDMIRLVERLGSGRTGPTFSTIHKAKGLEAEHVYILRPDLMPAYYATGRDALQQEENMIYVGITRAISSLTWGVEAR